MKIFPSNNSYQIVIIARPIILPKTTTTKKKTKNWKSNNGSESKVLQYFCDLFGLYFKLDTSPVYSLCLWLKLGRLTFVPDGICKINVWFEAERFPVSTGPPSGGRATLIAQHGTGPSLSYQQAYVPDSRNISRESKSSKFIWLTLH